MPRSSVNDRRSSMWKLPRVLKDSWRWRLSNYFVRFQPGRQYVFANRAYKDKGPGSRTRKSPGAGGKGVTSANQFMLWYTTICP